MEQSFKAIICNTRRLRAVVLLLFATLSPATLAGQDTVRLIEEVRIEGMRNAEHTALTHTVLDSAAIAESAGLTFVELLTRHTPVFVKSYGMGSMATVSFRGSGASHTQVEWNGIGINNPMLGQVDVSLIPVRMVDRVELYHGGSSLRTSGGALGGSIAINSAPEWDRSFYGNVAQEAGSYGRWQSFVSLGGGNRSVQARVRYLYEQADNDYSYINTALLAGGRMRQKNADYSKHAATADLFWNAGRGNVLSLNMWYHYNDRNLPPSMTQANSDRTEWQKDSEVRAVLKWKKYSRRFHSELTTGYTRLKLDYYDDFLTQFGSLYLVSDSRTGVNSFYNRYRAEYFFSDRTSAELAASVDYHAADYVDYRYSDISNRPDRLEAGVAATLRHNFSARLSSFALLRGDFSDSGNSPLIFALGAAYTPFERRDMVLKVNFARNYHRPTLNDLYWKPGGNPDLKPEEGYTADISAAYGARLGQFDIKGSATAYFSWIDDWIIWRPDPESGYSYWTAQNIREVFSRGLELGGSLGYTAGKFHSAVYANYAYTRTTNQNAQFAGDASQGKQLMYVPKHKGNVMVETSYGGWYLRWVWSAVSERFTNSSNEPVRHNLPAYDLHDATLGRKFTMWKCRFDLQARVNNVFGRDYQMLLYRPMPGTNLTFSLGVAF